MVNPDWDIEDDESAGKAAKEYLSPKRVSMAEKRKEVSKFDNGFCPPQTFPGHVSQVLSNY